MTFFTSIEKLQNLELNNSRHHKNAIQVIKTTDVNKNVQTHLTWAGEDFE